MERKSLSHSLKYHSIGAEDTPTANQKHRSPRPNMFTAAAYQSCGDHRRHPQSHLHDYVAGNGLSWPPRTYPCTFCKREFRSAQALGGHMNVHRRDRARLRQSSPPPASAATVSADGQYSFPHFNPGRAADADAAANPNPKPNPNLPSSSSGPFLPTISHAPVYCTFTATIPQHHLGTPFPFSRPGLTAETKAIKGDFIDGPDPIGKHPARIEDLCLWTKGLASDTGRLMKLGMEVEVGNKDLDLELRLGWP
ncbi:hypothetical protein MLD38_039576 [Melastoma candidum]|uniref:Uncharacterized protein n=1 Tax=Melastoma candidum TaxID=119954 RepID=A0ACB9L3V5_9MYRT|nr:hypothetical protein MLD38_039576 [Melastoma candidum]